MQVAQVTNLIFAENWQQFRRNVEKDQTRIKASFDNGLSVWLLTARCENNEHLDVDFAQIGLTGPDESEK